MAAARRDSCKVGDRIVKRIRDIRPPSRPNAVEGIHYPLPVGGQIFEAIDRVGKRE